MSDRKSILKASGLLGLLTLISRFTGLVRDMVMAALFGATLAADVFFIAFQLPNLARRVLGEGALSSFIVPLFTGRMRDKGAESAWRFVNRTISFVLVLTIVLVAVGIVGAEWVFKIFGGFGMIAHARDADPQTAAEVLRAVEHGIFLTRLMLPYMIGLAVAAIMMGVCHSLKNFGAPGWGSIVVNITTIVGGLMAFALGVGKYEAGVWLAWSVLAGAVCRGLIMTPALYKAGWRFKFGISFEDPDILRLFKMMGAGIFGLAVAQINIAVAVFLAGFMGEGNVAYLNYANRLIQFPMALTATTMATALLPSIAALLHEGSHKRLREVIGFTERIEIVIMLPAMLGLMFFGYQIVEMLFQRGNFDAADTYGTYQALLFYAPGLLPLGWNRLIIPFFYAQRKVSVPVRTAAVGVLTNVILGSIFTFYTDLEQRGLALSSSIGALVNYMLLSGIMRRDPAKPLSEVHMMETLTKCLVAGLLAVGGCRLAYGFVEATLHDPSNTLTRFLVLMPFIALTIPLYFGLAHLLRVPDSHEAINLVKSRLQKRRDGRKAAKDGPPAEQPPPE